MLLLKDAATRANLYAAMVEHETVAAYQAAVNELERQHCRVQAIVGDGRRGLFTAFGQRDVSPNRHRYLTRKPKLPAAQELWRLPRLKEEDFNAAFNRWHDTWRSFLDQRTVSAHRSRYAHPRLRSTFLSIQRNLPWLFTCLRYPMLQIPNTTNLLDGHFAELKNKLRNHNGLSTAHRAKLIGYFLAPAIINYFVH